MVALLHVWSLFVHLLPVKRKRKLKRLALCIWSH